MLSLWSLTYEHDRQNSGALLQSIIGHFKSMMGASLLIAGYLCWIVSC